MRRTSLRELPQQHGMVVAARGEQRAVAGDGERADGGRVSAAAEQAHALARRDLPHADREVIRARGEQGGVGVEGAAADVGHVADEDAHRLLLVDGEEAHLVGVRVGGRVGV